MSFFGFEQKDLENEKQQFLGGRLRETEDLNVYALGEEGYDGLGDSLQEGGDELNDETFGGTGVVGAPDMLFALVAICSMCEQAKTLTLHRMLCHWTTDHSLTPPDRLKTLFHVISAPSKSRKFLLHVRYIPA
jgi:hypothetical protein